MPLTVSFSRLICRHSDIEPTLPDSPPLPLKKWCHNFPVSREFCALCSCFLKRYGCVSGLALPKWISDWNKRQKKNTFDCLLALSPTYVSWFAFYNKFWIRNWCQSYTHYCLSWFWAVWCHKHQIFCWFLFQGFGSWRYTIFPRQILWSKRSTKFSDFNCRYGNYFLPFSGFTRVFL